MQMILRILIVIFSLSAISLKATDLDDFYIELENSMDSSVFYDHKKELKIIGLKEMLLEENSLNQKYLIVNYIINEYEKYNFDSALYYIEYNLNIAEQIVNVEFKNESNLKLAAILCSSGRYKESLDILKGIHIDYLSGQYHIEFLDTYRKIYKELCFYSQVNKSQELYKKLYMAYTDSLLIHLIPQSDKYLSIIETQQRDNRKLEECEKVNKQRFEKLTPGTKRYSLIAFERSLIYELKGDVNNQKKYLILSAISDIKASVKDNASLTILASILFNEGQIHKAHDYINFSFKDAEFYNSRLRFIGISNILPLITEAYEDYVDKQKTKLRNSLLIISVLTILLLFTVLYIYKQIKKLAKARNELKTSNEKIKANNLFLNSLNSQLSESNHVKEQYIGSFLGIWSNFIDKLNSYRKMVNKQIEDRNVAELHKITKSRKLIDDELNEFYENFDSTFLSIYPNFVEEFNKLLEEEGKIFLKKNELLNTELRIFALIRLGINDSTKIAGLLRYSVRTIYNYRVKIKNKAIIPRDDFEKHILRIGEFA